MPTSISVLVPLPKYQHHRNSDYWVNEINYEYTMETGLWPGFNHQPSFEIHRARLDEHVNCKINKAHRNAFRTFTIMAKEISFKSIHVQIGCCTVCFSSLVVNVQKDKVIIGNVQSRTHRHRHRDFIFRRILYNNKHKVK